MNKTLDWWASEGGSSYMDRNSLSPVMLEKRTAALNSVIYGFNIKTVLEVGSGPGGNLVALRRILTRASIQAIEPNPAARKMAAAAAPYAKVVAGDAENLPFEDNTFDLALTAGVLIHVSPESLNRAMSEIVRVSKKYVLAIEYFAPECTPVQYYGDERLWKNNFGKIYQNEFKLKTVDYGFFIKEFDDYDNCVWWLLEK